MRWGSMLLVGLLGASGCSQPPAQSGLDLGVALGGDASGYARALDIRRFSFPEDHFSHPEFRNEWWYLTGNLSTDNGDLYGYQVTFFRTAISPQRQADASHWRSHQLWMAHAALSNGQTKRHLFAERWSRDALKLAGVQQAPFRVWLDDWRIEATQGAAFPWQVTLKTEQFELALTLSPQKPIVLQGNQGLSQKSSAPGNASYYYSLPRLDTSGTLTQAHHSMQVTGLSWLDREWSSSALTSEQVGWDWFALQLEDGRDLMIYQLRRKDGQTDPHSAGTLIDKQGRATALQLAEFQLQPLRWWQTKDGASYPTGWRITLPAQDLDLKILPLFDAQEMQTTLRYWEGAVIVQDQRSGTPLGRGYLEMTGYVAAPD